MDNATRMVQLVSTVDRTIVVNRPEYGIRRQWVAKGQSQSLPFDIVQNLYFTVGFQNLINEGILYIPNMQDKIDLNIEPQDATQPTRVIVLNDQQMKTLLTVTPYNDFVKQLAHLPMSQAHALVDYAVKNDIIDNMKVQYLKQVTGRDIVRIIARKRESEEIDKIQAAREEAYKQENAGRIF